LAFGEALANAVEHGSSAGGDLSIRVQRISGDGQFATLEIEIADEGSGFVERPHPPIPDLTGSRGFGIYIMRAVMDTVEYHDGGRRVILSKRLHCGCPSTSSG
jgi:anti-sigma regulatory factor (Ser/Thr protein kinase)